MRGVELTLDEALKRTYKFSRPLTQLSLPTVFIGKRIYGFGKWFLVKSQTSGGYISPGIEYIDQDLVIYKVGETLKIKLAPKVKKNGK